MNYPDPTEYHDAPHPSPEQAPKRQRQSSEDAAYVPNKRGKARERKRRKRERDRVPPSSTVNPNSEGPSNVDVDSVGGYNAEGETSSPFKKKGGGRKIDLNNLPPEEAAKKERVRMAARERQRKHRASVKARRMAELGMAIVNEGGGIEQTAIGYTINENGQYEAVLANPGDPNLHPQIPYPILPPHATAGQMFASTLFIGLSCTPQLRAQLLRHLRASPEELAAFEPCIAAAFDHWDHGRSLHYAAQGQPVPSSHAPQGTPYGQTYQSFERAQRPIIQAFPPSPPRAPERSPSPSEEDHRRGHVESEARIEPQPTLSEQSLRVIKQTDPSPRE